jgi:peptide/nickel transport system permease protein
MSAAAAARAVAVDMAPAPARRSWARRLVRNPSGLVGLVLCGILAIAALAAIAGVLPHDPLEQDTNAILSAPSSEHWFGTDQFGRDIFSRVLVGIRSSAEIAITAVALAAAVGVCAGVVAAYFGRWVSAVVLRVTDVLFAFPAILLALAIATALGHGWFNTSLAVAIVYIPIFVRVSRGPVLALRDADFIRAGRVLGFSSWRLLFRHVLPNISAVVVVQITLSLSWAVLTESALSFLGLGTQPPTPSLGRMVSDATTLAATAWWSLAAPAAAITMAVLGLNLLGDGLRDAFDPTESRR